jgi:hypothetical protein
MAVSLVVEAERRGLEPHAHTYQALVDRLTHASKVCYHRGTLGSQS